MPVTMRRSMERSRVRRRSPIPEPSSKRRRSSSYSPRNRAYDRDRDDRDYDRRPYRSYNSPRSYRRREPSHVPSHASSRAPPPSLSVGRSRRLYVGNVPFHARLSDFALSQFFSALYVAAFRPNLPNEPLPVVSFWLHTDGKFGFMEVRGEQEAVNMMQFNAIVLHGRPLRVNRPSDYRPELHNPAALNLVPDQVNVPALLNLCSQLGPVVAPPPSIANMGHTVAKMDTTPDSPQRAAVPVKEVSLPVSNPNDTKPEPEPVKAEEKPVAAAKAEPSPIGSVKTGALNNGNVSAPVVISLKNLVTDEEINSDDEEFEEIVMDVRDECGKYGSVEEVNIPRSGHWKGNAFVQFSSPDSAKAAIDALRKRIFDGRQVIAVAVEGCATATEAANR